jgi:PIN domain nuclease of toxin-antitoxin system
VKRYLLDTHVVIWALTKRKRLGARTLRILEEEEIHISSLSIWEMLSKHDDGQLKLPNGSLIEMLQASGAHMLPLTAEHAEAGLALSALHGDPVDRMLVGTARVERMILLTRDANLLERAAPLLGPLLQEA